MSTPVGTPPKIPPKKRSSGISTIPQHIKKRQSNIFELSSRGSHRVSATSLGMQSRSMDDLDKIERENEGGGSQNASSEENLSARKASGENQGAIKDRNDNLTIVDEENPPPLFPRKKSVKLTDDGYDTLAVPPNLADRLRPTHYTYLRPSTYDTVQITSNLSPSSAKTDQKPAGNLKHRYANLDGEIAAHHEQPQPHHSSDVVDEPYDVLVLPRSTPVDPNRNPENKKTLLDENSVNANMAGRKSPNTTNVGLEARRADSRNVYETVTLHNAPQANGNTNGSSTGIHSMVNVYETLILRSSNPGKQDPPQANSVSDVYDYLEPKHLRSKSPAKTTADEVTRLPSSTNESRVPSVLATPTLRPKTPGWTT